VIVEFSIRAQMDLCGLVEFVAPKNPDAADAIGDRLIDACLSLADLPFKGRSSDLHSSIREMVIGNYVAIYRVRDPLVEILHLYHSAEDWKK
jgi:toxin ParE1/3/4